MESRKVFSVKKALLALFAVVMLAAGSLLLTACGEKVTLTFVVDGEIYDTITTETTDVGEAITMPEDPVKTGYSFDGWFTDAQFTQEFTVYIMPKSNTTLYAKLSPISYTINYELDGGTNDASNPATYTIESDTITLADATKTYYTFGGWFDNADFEGTAITEIAAGTYGDLTLYAKFAYGTKGLEYSYDETTSTATVTGYTGSDTDVAIPSMVDGYAVTTIRSYTFPYNTAITSIIIPSSITTIGGYAFGNCPSLTAVYVDSIETWLGISFGDYGANPLTYSKGKLYVLNDEKTDYILLTELTIPSNVTTISAYAFYGCTSLTSVTIESGVTCIGNGAFYECSNLTEVTIPDSVTSIGANAFRECSNLESITIPSGVESIENYTFSACTSLTSVVIPDSVTSIGNQAFFGCTSLVSVTGGNCVATIGSEAFLNCTSLTGTIGSDALCSIGSEAFYWCSSLTGVTIGSGATTIGSSAFYRCSSLTIINFNATSMNDFSSSSNLFYYAGENSTGITVNIGANVTKIPARLFSTSSSSSVPNITSIAFADESVLASIGDYAFYYLTSLTSITIPSSVTSIGDYAFYNCKNLASAYIFDLEAWCNISFGNNDSNPMYYAKNLYLNGSIISGSVTLSSSVTKIPYGTFKNSNITSITIPDSVTSIEAWAFYYCIKMTSVTIGSGVTSIEAWAFTNCNALMYIYYNAIAVSDLSSQAFAYSGQSASITRLTIGANVTKIPAYLFYQSSIKSVVFASGSACESIGNYAFYLCSKLTSFAIPNSVTSIGNYAFYGCSGLTSVTGASGLVTIGQSAFEKCSSLVSVECGASVTTVESCAFYGCSALTIVYYGGTPSELDAVTIDSYNTPLTSSATVYCYSEEEPNFTIYDYYWHYDVDDNIVIWTQTSTED